MEYLGVYYIPSNKLHYINYIQHWMKLVFEALLEKLIMSELCDLCGRPGANKIANVAGAKVLVCESCARLGEVVEEIREPERKEAFKSKPTIAYSHHTAPEERPERVEEVLGEIGTLIREERERRCMKQEDLAKKINEPESLIKRIEHSFVPNLKIAHKLQRVLHIKLTEEVDANEPDYPSGNKKGNLTLGDIIVIKKKD